MTQRCGCRLSPSFIKNNKAGELMLMARQGVTLRDRVEEVGGISSGFDYLRIALAVAIIGWHTIVTLYGRNFEAPIWSSYRMFAGSLLPMFFALSGFLVHGSLERTRSVGKFLALRAVRIYPALAVEVVLSALLLGPLLTTIPLSEYFSDRQFWAYFHNILGVITFPLPGLFADNPFPSFTNVSLWTIPYELKCYVCLTAIALFRMPRRIVLFGFCALLIVETVHAAHLWPKSQFGVPAGMVLVLGFVSGVLASAYRDKIPFSKGLFFTALALQLALTSRSYAAYIAIIPTTYVTVYLGLLNPRKYTFLLKGDYSYGLYLFAFPIQQTYALLFPQHRVPAFSIAFTLCFGMAYAALSWHLIEKPILQRRKAIIDWAACALSPVTRMWTFAASSIRDRFGVGAADSTTE